MDKSQEWAEHWFTAGRSAYFAGLPRSAPFSKPIARDPWLIGWDAGAMEVAIRLGAQAQPGDPCPYADPALAACWRRGYTAAHGLTVIAGSKKPGSAPDRTQPGCSTQR